jgi:hypothetical protein
MGAEVEQHTAVLHLHRDQEYKEPFLRSDVAVNEAHHCAHYNTSSRAGTRWYSDSSQHEPLASQPQPQKWLGGTRVALTSHG